MLITIDPSSQQPLAEQVASSVRSALARGTARTGDKLPSAREVAAALDINLHTVLRGYQQLRDEGVVELRRGRAAVIIGTGDRPELTAAAREYAATVQRLGLGEAEALDAVRLALQG